jgi:hypothetical protein
LNCAGQFRRFVHFFGLDCDYFRREVLHLQAPGCLSAAITACCLFSCPEKLMRTDNTELWFVRIVVSIPADFSFAGLAIKPSRTTLAPRVLKLFAA